MLRLVLLLFSAVNVAAGLGLTGLYFKFRGGGGVPVIVLLIALALLVQGGFTIGYILGWWTRLGERTIQLFVAGEAAAVLVGILGTIQGILYNLHPKNGDQEFGPLMAALLIGAQAAVALIYAGRNERFGLRVSGHQRGNDR